MTTVKQLIEALQEHSQKEISFVVAGSDNWGINNFIINDLSRTHTDKKYHNEIELIFELGDNLDVVTSVDTGVDVVNNTTEALKHTSETTITKCPECSCEEILWDVKSIEPEGDSIYRVHKCSKCELKFDERYDLSKVEVEHGEQSDATIMQGTVVELADKLIEESEVVIDTHAYTVHVQDSSNGFDVSVYYLGSKYDEDFEFEYECLDGGIIEDGDAMDVIAYAYEFSYIAEFEEHNKLEHPIPVEHIDAIEVGFEENRAHVFTLIRDSKVIARGGKSVNGWISISHASKEVLEELDNSYRNRLTCNVCAADVSLCACEKEQEEKTKTVKVPMRTATEEKPLNKVICEGCLREVSEDNLSNVMEMNICNRCEDGVKK